MGFDAPWIGGNSESKEGETPSFSSELTSKKLFDDICDFISGAPSTSRDGRNAGSASFNKGAFAGNELVAKFQNSAGVEESGTAADPLFQNLHSARKHHFENLTEYAKLSEGRQQERENWTPERIALETEKVSKLAAFVNEFNKLPSEDRRRISSAIPYLSEADPVTYKLTAAQTENIRQELSANPNLLASFNSLQSSAEKVESSKSSLEQQIDTRQQEIRNQMAETAKVEREESAKNLNPNDLDKGKPGETRRAYDSKGNVLEVKYDEKGNVASYTANVKSPAESAGVYQGKYVEGKGFVDQKGNKVDSLGDVLYSSNFRLDNKPQPGDKPGTKSDVNQNEKSPESGPLPEQRKNNNVPTEQNRISPASEQGKTSAADFNPFRPGAAKTNLSAEGPLIASNSEKNPFLAQSSKEFQANSKVNAEPAAANFKAYNSDVLQRANREELIRQQEQLERQKMDAAHSQYERANPQSMQKSLDGKLDASESKSSENKFSLPLQVPSTLERTRPLHDLAQNQMPHSNNSDLRIPGVLVNHADPRVENATAKPQLGQIEPMPKNILGVEGKFRNSVEQNDLKNSRAIDLKGSKLTIGERKDLIDKLNGPIDKSLGWKNGIKIGLILAGKTEVGTRILDAQGRKLSLSARKEIIDKINGPIHRTLGSKDGIKIGAVVPAKDLIIKGKSGEGQGLESKLGRTSRVLRLEDLSLRVAKLPGETRLQACKIIEQLIKNPKQKFGSKDSAIADALRGLGKSELNALRLILKGGIQPDFSKFNAKQQSQLIFIFKTLLEQGQPKRIEMSNSAGSSALKRLIEQAKVREPETRSVTLRAIDSKTVPSRGADTRTVASLGIDTNTVKSRDIDTRTVPSSGAKFGVMASNGIDTKTAEINEDQSETRPMLFRFNGKIQSGKILSRKSVNAKMDSTDAAEVEDRATKLVDAKLSFLPPFSEILADGVKILQSECFTSDAHGIRISLRLQKDNRWETVCHYDVYSGSTRRTQYLKARNPEQTDMLLPAEESKIFALNDFRKNWKSLCHQYLTQN